MRVIDFLLIIRMKSFSSKFDLINNFSKLFFVKCDNVSIRFVYSLIIFIFFINVKSNKILS